MRRRLAGSQCVAWLPLEAACLKLPEWTLLNGCRNPAGKTSLLQVLAGKYMVGQDTVRILGRPAFHDIHLVGTACCHLLACCYAVPERCCCEAQVARYTPPLHCAGWLQATHHAVTLLLPTCAWLFVHCSPARLPLLHLTGTPLQVSSGALSYLGPQWRRDIAFAGNNVPMQVRPVGSDCHGIEG